MEELNNKFNKLLKEYIKTTKKECYKIKCVEGEPSLTDDKIGGYPYYPINEEYPYDDEGYPMQLLLQINLKNIDLENFPKKGILEVFIDKNFSYQGEYKVKYFEEGLEHYEEFSKIDNENFIVDEPIKISLSKDECNLSVQDYRFLPTVIKLVKSLFNETVTSRDDIEKKLDTIEWENEIFNKIKFHNGNIGGYPDFYQEDPRENKKTGIIKLLKNIFKSKKQNDKQKLDECIFKIDTRISNKIKSGDYTLINGLISKEDLKKGNLENTVIYWDCQ